MIDLTTDDLYDSQTDLLPLMADDKVSKEEKWQKERMRGEKNYETRLQCVDLKGEYVRCYPGCKIPNYHLFALEIR